MWSLPILIPTTPRLVRAGQAGAEDLRTSGGVGGGLIPKQAAAAAATATAAPGLAQGAAREKLTALLVTIADWILESGVGSNQLNNATYWDPPDAIFVNGNLARVLLAAGKITGKSEYGAVGLQWCDAFVTVQQQLTTSTGLPGGYWDTGYDVPARPIFVATI